MELIHSLPDAGGSKTHAVTIGTPGRVDSQGTFIPVDPYKLVSALTVCSKTFGLTASCLVVLRALLSCLKTEPSASGEKVISSKQLLTVYASNETICERAYGITDRQLRRHLATLELAGLLTRRDSSNGKRYPLKSKGQIVGAFGLDLSPMFQQSSAIFAKALQLSQEREEVRGIKAQILRLKGICHITNQCGQVAERLRVISVMIRRVSLSLREAKELHSEVAALTNVAPVETAICSIDEHANTNATVEQQPSPKTKHMPATDGQNVRHIESYTKSYIQKKKDSPAIINWASMPTIAALYPEPTTTVAAIRICYEVASWLGIKTHTLEEVISRTSMHRVLEIIDYIASAPDRIANPNMYIKQCVS